MSKESEYHFFSCDRDKVIQEIGAPRLLHFLEKMLLIRHFEVRGEAAYLQGKVGGFYHSYVGQEAIQASCVAAAGDMHWYATTYRCHALALLLGVTPNEAMAELYGKVTGNAKGRGGSMHFFADRLLGGFGIVGGHIPLAVGAAFSIKYLEKKNLASFCFFGDGAVAQGAFHESLNLATLWNLPCVFVVENNHWGMGTKTERAVSVKPIAERFGKCFNIPSYTLDGFDFVSCYSAFQEIVHRSVAQSQPILVEAIVHRFKGHSISDPGLYRSKDELQKAMVRDPILLLKSDLLKHSFLTDEQFVLMDQMQKEIVLASMNYADESPWPDPMTLEEGVMKP